MRAPDFWYSRDKGRLAAFCLTPLGWLYGAATALRLRFGEEKKVEVPVLCVGNLTAGGTGKTPITIALGRALVDKGYRPHFLSRGYGGHLRGPLQVNPKVHGYNDVGDEPLLLAQFAPTWISADRAAGAVAAARAGADLVIMDDGFQNPSLAKDFSILVVDGARGFGNEKLIPAGPLREFLSAGRARADFALIVERADLPTRPGLAGNLPSMNVEMSPGEGYEQLSGETLVAFAGIGDPEKFFSPLGNSGATIAEAVPYPDHHSYSESDISWLSRLAKEKGARLATTAKDAVRLRPDHGLDLLILDVEARFDDLEAIVTMLMEKLDLAASNGQTQGD